MMMIICFFLFLLYRSKWWCILKISLKIYLKNIYFPYWTPSVCDINAFHRTQNEWQYKKRQKTGDTVVQRSALLPHSENVLGFRPVPPGACVAPQTCGLGNWHDSKLPIGVKGLCVSGNSSRTYPTSCLTPCWHRSSL